MSAVRFCPSAPQIPSKNQGNSKAAPAESGFLCGLLANLLARDLPGAKEGVQLRRRPPLQIRQDVAVHIHGHADGAVAEARLHDLRVLAQAQGRVAAVDFAQAAIGPGMAIFSRYSRVLEASGRPMSVRTALGLIDQVLTEVLSEQEDEFDNDTRWAIAWFEQHGFGEGEFGQAELLSKAKVTTVSGLVEAGIVVSRGGTVRLLRPEELRKDWNPERDRWFTVWEATHHLLRVYYYEEAGNEATAGLLRQLGARGDLARELAYRLYSACEKRKWSQEAQAYNALVSDWPELARLAKEARTETGLLFADATEARGDG